MSASNTPAISIHHKINYRAAYNLNWPEYPAMQVAKHPQKTISPFWIVRNKEHKPAERIVTYRSGEYYVE